jgi:hypothetical protein
MRTTPSLASVRPTIWAAATALCVWTLHAADGSNRPQVPPARESGARMAASAPRPTVDVTGVRGVAAVAAANDELARIEVMAVRFARVSLSGSSNRMWNETDVEVNIRPTSARDGARFVNRVKVTLTLAIDGASGEHAYYRASAEAVALEVGRANFRFYLPPEVVRRDRLRAEARVYAVEISAGGQPIAAGKFATNAPDARVFLDIARKAAAENEGILLPQHLTPFAFDREREAPSVVRADMQPEGK